MRRLNAVRLLPPTGDTIAAIATAPGSGAVGIIRLSGPQAFSIADSLFAPRRGDLPSSLQGGRFAYGEVKDGAVTVDEALLLAFRAPHSYTAEDVVEFQTHGGPAVLRATLDLCVASGARLAEPGEFTLRAYLNGRIDLVQAESVLDMVNAQSEGARRNAALGLTGALGAKLGEIQTEVTGAYAAVQASFDYPEEGIPEAELGSPLCRAKDAAEELLATAEAGRLSRQGARLAIVGRPNAGKSSLLNALLGFERSIVSAAPGTTRDYLEAPLVIGGVPLTAIDTAGIREAGSSIEASGVVQARRLAENADLRLLLIDGSQPLHEGDVELLSTLPEKRTLLVINKIDRSLAFDPQDASLNGARRPLQVSALTGVGLEELKAAIRDELIGDAAGTELWVTQERHVVALDEVVAHLGAALLHDESGQLDLVALELQDALNALGRITGRHEVGEETLAAIFSTFCVGK